MKRLLFIHGGEKAKEDVEGNFYTDGSYSKEIWQRYKEICKTISVIFRKDEKIYDVLDAKQRFQPLDNDITFYEAQNRSSSIKSFISIKKEIYNRKLVSELVKSNDYIIARVPSNIGYYAIKKSNEYNKKCLVEVVGCPFDSLWNYGIKGKLLAIPSFFQMKKNIKIAHNVIYVTNHFLQKRYPTKGNSIGCSDVSLIETNEKCLDNRLNKINSKISSTIVIGTCAAIDVKYKGQQYVIKALGKLVERGLNIEYQLVGNGSSKYLSMIAKKYHVEDKVKFVGSLPHEKVFDWLDNIDIYIQPSNTEGLSRSVIEAMSRACPCIVSNVGGNPELIEKDYLFSKKNSNDIASLLIDILNDKKKMISMAKTNFNNSKRYYKKELDTKRKQFYDKVFK